MRFGLPHMKHSFFQCGVGFRHKKVYHSVNTYYFLLELALIYP